MSLEEKIALVPASPDRLACQKAKQLSENTGLRLLDLTNSSTVDILILVDVDKLMVSKSRPNNRSGSKPFLLDWFDLDVFSSKGKSGKQPLIKAVRGRKKSYRPTVLDATAGWGEDTWLLSCLGQKIIAVEKNRAIFLLLQDAWRRAGLIYPQWAERIVLVNQDSLELLQDLIYGKESISCLTSMNSNWIGTGIDVVYLDPMFPDYHKRKAAEKKRMRFLRELAGEDKNDPEQFLRLALKVAQDRVVVKRAKKDPFYAKEVAFPVHSIEGRSIRYDIYLPHLDQEL